MSESKSHKITANRIAKKLGTEQHIEKGVDIVTPNIAIEVETPDTIKDATKQLQGQRKPVYIAGTNKQAIKKALDVTVGTTIGVMDNKGNIIKRSTRRKT